MQSLPALLFIAVAALFFTGCAATVTRYVDETALTCQLPVQDTPSYDIPIRFFNEDLPERYQANGLGIINDQETFAKMWRLYTKNNTALPPSIDFQNNVLLFVYNPHYYNQVSIIGLNVWNGIANPIILKSDKQFSIEGNPITRKIREQEGKRVNDPIVSVALLQLQRHREDRPGVTAVLVEGNSEDFGESRVIPIPSEP